MEFKKEFEVDLTLKGATFTESGESSEFEYYCCPSTLTRFKQYLWEWLADHEFPFSYIMLSRNISVTCSQELSDGQIKEFEREFEVKLKKYEISCNSKDIEYEFINNSEFLIC